MRRNRLLYFIAITAFIVLLGYALLQEMERNQKQIEGSISGVIKATPSAGSVIVKTDNAYLMLFEPGASYPVATKVMNPFLPPTTFFIGEEDALKPLKSSYRLLILSDKDGNPDRPAVGEVIGTLTEPLKLGTEAFEYILDRPFQGFPKELQEARRADPQWNIAGTVNVSPAFQAQISPQDRLVIMLFDPQLGRPVAFRILENFNLPQEFRIGTMDAMPGIQLKGDYSLRILTDKNNQPFESAPGELVVRSKELLSMGTVGLSLILDSEYRR
jgi:hypothetical protein